MCVALDEPQLLQRVELVVEYGEVLDGFLHRLALAGKVFLFVARIGLVAQQVLGVFGHILQIAQIVHVGIETGAADEVGTDADGHHDKDDSYQTLVAVHGVGVDAVDQGEGLLIDLVTFLAEQLWQIGQAEEGGAEDGEGCKETEVLQQVGLDEDQSCEGADGRQTTEPDGFHLVAQQTGGVADILEVGQHVEHIAQRHTEHDTADAQGQ